MTIRFGQRLSPQAWSRADYFTVTVSSCAPLTT
jgi:hypothetical protein